MDFGVEWGRKRLVVFGIGIIVSAFGYFNEGKVYCTVGLSSKRLKVEM
jgi:hypothetical protein